jgi:hypothetical protein
MGLYEPKKFIGLSSIISNKHLMSMTKVTLNLHKFQLSMLTIELALLTIPRDETLIHKNTQTWVRIKPTSLPNISFKL